MITISKEGNTIKFVAQNSQYWLQNGTIEVPVNSLSLIADESDMATFMKAASGDIFISAPYTEFGMDKNALIQFYKDNMAVAAGGSTGGGGGDIDISNLTSRLDTTESNVSALQTKVGNNDKAISGLTSSVNTLSANTASTNANVENLTTKVGNNEKAISGLNTSVTSITSDVSTLKTNTASTNEAISTLQTNTAATNTSVTSLTSRVSTNETNISTLTTKVNNTEEITFTLEDGSTVTKKFVIGND